jgi:hypothetical protein
MTLQIILTYLAVDAVASLLALYILHKRRDQFKALLSQYLNIDGLVWSAASKRTAIHENTFHSEFVDRDILESLLDDSADGYEGADH